MTNRSKCDKVGGVTRRVSPEGIKGSMTGTERRCPVAGIGVNGGMGKR